MNNALFKIAFLYDQNTLVISPSHTGYLICFNLYYLNIFNPIRYYFGMVLGLTGNSTQNSILQQTLSSGSLGLNKIKIIRIVGCTQINDKTILVHLTINCLII